MFKYTEICHKMRNAWFSLKNKKKERVLITILYAKAFLYAIFFNRLELVSCCLNRCAVVVDCVCDSHWRFVVLMTEAQGLCIKLLGWGLLIGRARGFPLSQVVAALVLLPHAVDQEEDEEDGEQEADHAACNNSCGRNGTVTRMTSSQSVTKYS